MKIDVKIDISSEYITQELNDYIRLQMPHIINETLFKDLSQLDAIIKKAVYGIFSNEVNSIVQSKDIRTIIRDRIWKHLNIEEMIEDKNEI